MTINDFLTLYFKCNVSLTFPSFHFTVPLHFASFYFNFIVLLLPLFRPHFPLVGVWECVMCLVKKKINTSKVRVLVGSGKRSLRKRCCFKRNCLHRDSLIFINIVLRKTLRSCFCFSWDNILQIMQLQIISWWIIKATQLCSVKYHLILYHRTFAVHSLSKLYVICLFILTYLFLTSASTAAYLWFAVWFHLVVYES